MSSVPEAFRLELQRIRARQGLTQKPLSALTKMSASFIGEMERGLKAPNLEGVVAIAWALRVSVEEMVAGFNTAGPR
jgi:transcriptional regulator with XRE-family HTH domain